MPFRDPRGGNLGRRIEAELRERLEEAVDAACLDTLVRVRQAQRLPPPQADNARDRAEYESEVRRLLERLDGRLSGLIADAPEAHAVPEASEDPVGQLMRTQIALARSLPDYWQRFDAVRIEHAAERAASGGESRGFLRRLFGLG
jgi:hypothetical protein